MLRVQKLYLFTALHELQANYNFYNLNILRRIEQFESRYFCSAVFQEYPFSRIYDDPIDDFAPGQPCASAGPGLAITGP